MVCLVMVVLVTSHLVLLVEEFLDLVHYRIMDQKIKKRRADLFKRGLLFSAATMGTGPLVMEILAVRPVSVIVATVVWTPGEGLRASAHGLFGKGHLGDLTFGPLG
jgi:hypothetical protein